jgi:hypothetical protein
MSILEDLPRRLQMQTDQQWLDAVTGAGIDDFETAARVADEGVTRVRELLLKLDSARAAAAPAKHVAIVTNNNQPGWTNIVETAPNVTLHVGSKLYDESALIGVGVALVEQRAAEIIDLEYRLSSCEKERDELRQKFEHAVVVLTDAAIKQLTVERDESRVEIERLEAQHSQGLREYEALESRLDESEKRCNRIGAYNTELVMAGGRLQDALNASERRLTWRRIRDGRPTEPGFYAMVYMPSDPFYRAIISTKVATFEEIGDPSHFHDEWQWLGPLPIAAPLADPSAPSESSVLAAVRAACEAEISFAEGGALTSFGEGSLKAHREILALLSAPSECAHHVFGITRSGDFTATPSNDDTRFAHCPNCGIAAPSEGEKP